RIQRSALRKIPQLHLRSIDFRDWPDSAEKGFRHTGLASFDEHIVQVLLHAAVAREIGVDELRGFLLPDSQLLREAERREPVDDAKVDRFCRAAVLRGLRQWPNAKNFLGCPRMNVLAIAKRFQQHRVL